MEIIGKTISVWLKLNNGANVNKFALQKRSQSEKHFPGVCQATWAGKVEVGETVENAIRRECEEELGSEFKNNFDFNSLKFISQEEFTMNETSWKSYNYTATISEENLKNIKFHTGAEPQFIFVNQNNEIYPLSSNKNPKEDIILFDDQYKILEKILNEH